MNKSKQHGLTLVELSAVLLILIVLASLVVPHFSGTSQRAMCQATDATMQGIKNAIMGPSGFYADTLGYFPKNTRDTTANYNLKYLMEPPSGWADYDPDTGVGWRGPYLMSGSELVAVANLAGNFAEAEYVHDLSDGDTVINDGWGRPIIIQFDASYGARLISAGPGNGIALDDANIDTKTDETLDAIDSNDDRVLHLDGATPAEDENPACK